jgi:hypothetical protein
VEQTAIAELALLVFLGLDRGPKAGPTRRRIQQLSRILNRLCADPRYPEFFSSQTGLAFTGTLLVWLALNQAPARWGPPHERIQQLIDRTAACYLPRTPYRFIELSYFLERGAFRHGLPPLQSILPLTAFSLPFRLNGIEDTAIYEHTHMVFYLTDFGRRRLVHLNELQGRNLAERTQFLLDLCIGAEHTDLIAELLLAHECLRAGSSKSRARGWAWLARTLCPATLVGCSDQVFLSRYHPVLISALSGLLPRHRGSIEKACKRPCGNENEGSAANDRRWIPPPSDPSLHGKEGSCL